jgi:hypothetical protein
MRFIKVFLIGIIGLFVVVTLMSLLLPSEVKVSRAVVINSTTDKIYTQVSDLKNWKNWHPAFKTDSVELSFSNPSIGKDANCNVTYKGKQTHLTITASDSSSIKFLLQSAGEDDIYNELTITPVKEENDIQVEWKALTKLHWYPWDKFYGIFIDRITGDGYENALTSLKEFVENK